MSKIIGKVISPTEVYFDSSYVSQNKIGVSHTQNTDTGTTGNTFTIDSDSTTGKIVLDVALNAGQNRTMTITNEAMTADRTITLPNATGTVSLDGHTHNLLAESIVLGDYAIGSDDTWETIAQSTTTFTGTTNIQVSAHITFRERNGNAGQLFLRLIDTGDNIYGSTTATYQANEYLCIAIMGTGSISAGATLYLQIYDKSTNSVYYTTDQSINGSIINIIGITTQ